MAPTATVPATSGRIEGASPLPASVAVAGAVAMLAAALVYLNSLGNPFVYDDFQTVVNNGSLVDPSQIRVLLLHDVARPLVNVSYALDRLVWGTGPVGFHVTNVVLHVVNVGLLFVLATVLAGRSGVANGWVAFTAAGLFAVHPMMSGAVGYVSARSELLCATWFLLALLAAHQAIVTGGRRRWLLATLLCWLLALASKEVAAVLPVVVVAMDRLCHPADAAARRRRLRRLHAPLVGLAVAAVAVRLFVFLTVEHAGPTPVVWQFGLVELDVFGRYLGLMLMPVGQTIYHDVGGPAAWGAVRGVAVAGGVLAVAWWLRHRAPIVSLGLAWFFLLLLPSALLVMLDRGEPMVEHRVYVAACGLFLSAGALLHGIVASRLARAGTSARQALRAATVVVLVALAVATIGRTRVWADPITLWSESVRRAPEAWLPHLLLGEAQHAAGRHADAAASFRRVVELRPEEPRGYARLGLCLAETGRDDEAIEVYRALQAQDPDSADAESGLGIVALMTGRMDEARRHFLTAVRLAPDHVDARLGLAMIAESVDGDPAAALRWCEAIAVTAPGTPAVADCIARNRARLGGGG